MIVVYTAYDPVSHLLAACAGQFLTLAGDRVCHALGPPTGSCAAQVREVLTARPDLPLVFFGHGDRPPTGPLAQDATPFLAECSGQLLRNRFVCAFCCHGVEALADHAAAVLGFTGELQMVCQPPYDAYLRDCLLVGLQELLAGAPVSLARRKIEDAFRGLARRLLPTLSLAHFSVEHLAWMVFMDNADAIQLSGNPDSRW